VSTEFRVQSSGTGSVTELVLVGMFNVAGCQCRSSVVCFVGGAVCGVRCFRLSAVGGSEDKSENSEAREAKRKRGNTHYVNS
jgi:hypothetical protein